MKRIHLLLAAPLLVAAIAAASVGSAGAATPARASRATKVQLRHTRLGSILVDSTGFTLYAFTKDPRAKDTCVHISGCSAIWPALTTGSTPTAGPGVKSSLLSSITLSNGTRQVTYAGHPLYRYSPASESGETSYVGARQFGGSWLALSATGGLVK